MIVIGAQKCGTTSLHHYLGSHPEIAMSREKELNFFLPDDDWTRGEGSWSHGVDWYASHFDGPAKIVGESSPAYTYGPVPNGVPARMFGLVPTARLICIVRPPIDRIVSHYVHFCAAGFERRSFEEACLDERSPYLDTSRYAGHLEEYLEYYPISRLLIVTQDDLRDRRRSTLRSIFEYLEVDPGFYSSQFEIERHRTDQKLGRSRIGQMLARHGGDRIVSGLPPKMRHGFERVLYLPFSRRIVPPSLSGSLRRRLSDVLQDDVRRLEALAGRRFGGWLD